MASFDFPTIGLLLFIASVVAMLTRRLGVPYSVGLVVAGLGLSFVPTRASWLLTPALVFEVFLAPLIFEAAIQIEWKPLRREMPLLLALVTLGVVLASALVAAGTHYLMGWSWLSAAFFGVLLSATDPVSVIALFKTLHVPPRLHLLVEAESLLNDGVAAVGFGVLVTIAAGGEAGIVSIGHQLAFTVVGGVAVGVLVALPLLFLAGGTSDRLVEVTLTTLIAWGSFLLADHFHFSGVLATLTAGLIVGNYGMTATISPEGRQSMINFWEYVAFLVNSLIFILIGAREAQFTFAPVLGAAAVATVLSLLGRAVCIYPVAGMFARTGLAVPWRFKHVLVWGGLRGALALALALALPDIPERTQVVTATFAVVAFSIIVQGLSMQPLVRWLRLSHPPEEEREVG